MPKAGSTSVLWALLELTELGSDEFARSTKLETTRSLTIHDVSVWGDARRLAARRDREVRQLFDSQRWLTFTVVREPVRRIWSAWVSKVLLRDPRFVAVYGDEEWFPAAPRSAVEIVASFRRFVEVLLERPEAWHDPHWSCQAELLGIGDLAYGVVGRVEDLSGVIEVVDAHLRARGRGGLRLRRENPSLVSFLPEILDRESLERCAVLTVRDREVFGYELVTHVPGELDHRWKAEVEARIPAIHAVIERNERIGDLKRIVTRNRAS